MIDLSGEMDVNAGTLELGAFSESVRNIGTQFNISGGTAAAPTVVELQGRNEVLNYGNLFVGTTSGDHAILNINGDLTLNSSANSSSGGGQLRVGAFDGTVGALIQNSGSVKVASGSHSTHFFVVGNYSGYGYCRLNGGEFSAGQLAIGGANFTGNRPNIASLDLFDGTLIADRAHLMLAWHKSLVALNIFNGIVTGGASNGGKIICCQNANGDSVIQINLLGSGAQLYPTPSTATFEIDLANKTGNRLSALNLNAGVMAPRRIFATDVTSTTILNFNGGLLQSDRSVTNWVEGLTEAHVYDGGAHIDTTDREVTINQPLLAPQGYGLAAVELLSPGAGYIGAPSVEITGGGGLGATAIALVDLNEANESFGEITNILVTCAGSGYAADDTLTVVLHGGGFTTAATVGSTTLAANTSGGLAKYGTGTLVLGGANTYSGGSDVLEGTLKIGVADALLTASKVTLAQGAKLDLNNFSVTNSVAGVGEVVNGSLYNLAAPGGEGNVGEASLTLGYNVTLSGVYRLDVMEDGSCDRLNISGYNDLSGIELQLVDQSKLNRQKRYIIATVDTTPVALFSHNLDGSKWRLSVDSSGELALYYSSGTMIMIR